MQLSDIEIKPNFNLLIHVAMKKEDFFEVLILELVKLLFSCLYYLFKSVVSNWYKDRKKHKENKT